jgi:hypothetical protein
MDGARRNLVLVTATLTVAGTAAACSILLKGDSVQCATTSDCVAKGGKFATSVCAGGICELASTDTGPLAHTPFSCLDADAGDSGVLATYEAKVVFYDLDATRSGRTTATIDGFAYAPIAGMAVKTCFPLDDKCTMPEATLKTDDAGTVSLSFQQSAPVYLDAEDPAYLPTLFFPPSYVRPGDKAFLVGILMPDQFAGAAQAAGVNMSRAVGPDASLGNIVASTFDCERVLAANVAWTLDHPDGSTRGYVVGGLIDTTTATVTSSEGTAVFYNTRVLTTEVSASYGDSGVVLQSQSVVIRAGAQSVVFSWP